MGRHPLMSNASLSGAGSGSVTTIAFAAVHDVLISDIWFSLLPMLVMGALCGAILAWSYGVLFKTPEMSTWLMYNSAYLALLVPLGIASLLLFDPVATTTALIAANEPPGELIAKTLPLTAIVTLCSVGVVSMLWGRALQKIAAVSVTSTLIIGLFGLNISVIGLVDLSGEGGRLVALFFGLIAAIIWGNAAVFVLIQRRNLLSASGPVGAKPLSSGAGWNSQWLVHPVTALLKTSSGTDGV